MASELGARVELTTMRLRLRRWRVGDAAEFAAMNADPHVMEHFPAPLSRAESAFMLEQIEAGFERNGFGIWALEVAASGAFIGFTGLSVVPFAAHFTPAVEVGWRLAEPAWGHGYATEAARAALSYGFGPAGLAEIVSFTAVSNTRSAGVMRRLGMHRDDSGDFDHPLLEHDHPLRRHVLYRLAAAEYAGAPPSEATPGSGPRR
jgi:ribosomal-protein-alanine N-acetyltransferase